MGRDRERHWYEELTVLTIVDVQKEVPTLSEFWLRFFEGHAQANRQKPSGIAAKETIGQLHLVPTLGTSGWRRSRLRPCSSSNTI
jgi:hypothetical protein